MTAGLHGLTWEPRPLSKNDKKDPGKGGDRRCLSEAKLT